MDKIGETNHRLSRRRREIKEVMPVYRPDADLEPLPNVIVGDWVGIGNQRRGAL